MGTAMTCERSLFCSAESVSVGRFRMSVSSFVTSDGLAVDPQTPVQIKVGRAADPVSFTQSVATALGSKLTAARKKGDLWWVHPDSRTKVTIEFVQRTDGTAKPLRIHTVTIVQDVSRATSQELADTSSVAKAPAAEESNGLIEAVLRSTLLETVLGDEVPALDLCGVHTQVHVASVNVGVPLLDDTCTPVAFFSV